jgi:hypothetical protein
MGPVNDIGTYIEVHVLDETYLVLDQLGEIPRCFNNSSYRGTRDIQGLGFLWWVTEVNHYSCLEIWRHLEGEFIRRPGNKYSPDIPAATFGCG